MKLKINKLLPYSEESKKYKTAPVNINNRTYYTSPSPLERNNYVGIVIPLQFVCTMPDPASDYEYLRCNVPAIIVRSGSNPTNSKKPLPKEKVPTRT